MLAPSTLDPRYEHWNRQWLAPYGRRRKKLLRERIRLLLLPSKLEEMRWKGAFGFQGNNDTREFEYPWAYHASELRPGMTVLEIGGGLSGFQFVLSAEGCTVHNVDPGLTELDWEISHDMIARMNEAFRGNVKLIKSGIEAAELKPGEYDRAISISVLEHLDPQTLPSAVRNVYAALKPGGLFVLTVDLFLDLWPFSDKKRNRFGSNVSIKALADAAPFELIVGERSQLFGFEEFDPKRILANLPDYLIGRGYPVLTQAFVLRKV